MKIKNLERQSQLLSQQEQEEVGGGNYCYEPKPNCYGDYFFPDDWISIKLPFEKIKSPRFEYGILGSRRRVFTPYDDKNKC